MTAAEKNSVEFPFSATLNSTGILEVHWNREVLEITKEHILLIKSLLYEKGKGIKLPLYVDAAEFIPISAEAREYIASAESAEYTLANAVRIDTLAKKIIFNFLLRFFHPVVPTRAFTHQEDAFQWLGTLKKEYDLSRK